MADYASTPTSTTDVNNIVNPNSGVKTFTPQFQGDNPNLSDADRATIMSTFKKEPTWQSGIPGGATGETAPKFIPNYTGMSSADIQSQQRFSANVSRAPLDVTNPNSNSYASIVNYQAPTQTKYATVNQEVRNPLDTTGGYQQFNNAFVKYSAPNSFTGGGVDKSSYLQSQEASKFWSNAQSLPSGGVFVAQGGQFSGQNIEVNRSTILSLLENKGVVQGWTKQIVSKQEYDDQMKNYNPFKAQTSGIALTSNNITIMSEGIKKGLYSNAGEVLTGNPNPIFTPQNRLLNGSDINTFFGASVEANGTITPLYNKPSPISFTTPIPQIDIDRINTMKGISFFTSRYEDQTKTSVTGTIYNNIPQWLRSDTTRQPIISNEIMNDLKDYYKNNEFFDKTIILQGINEKITDVKRNPLPAIETEAINTELAYGGGKVLGYGIGSLTKSYYTANGLDAAIRLERGINIAGIGLFGAGIALNPKESVKQIIPLTAGGIGFGQGYNTIVRNEIIPSNNLRLSFEPKYIGQNKIIGIGEGNTKIRVIEFGVDKGIKDVPILVSMQGEGRIGKNTYLIDELNIMSQVSVRGISKDVYEQYPIGGLKITKNDAILSLSNKDQSKVFIAQNKILNERISEQTGLTEQLSKQRSALFTINKNNILQVSTVGSGQQLGEVIPYNKLKISFLENGDLMRLNKISNTAILSESGGINKNAGGINLKFANRAFNILESTGRFTSPTLENPQTLSIGKKGQLSIRTSFNDAFSDSTSFNKNNIYSENVLFGKQFDLSSLSIDTGFNIKNSPFIVPINFNNENVKNKSIVLSQLQRPTASLSNNVGNPFMLNNKLGFASPQSISTFYSQSFDVTPKQIPQINTALQQTIVTFNNIPPSLPSFIPSPTIDIPNPKVPSSPFMMFPSWGAGGGSLFERQRGKVKHKYIPSLTTGLLHIKGQKSGMLTPVSPRPIPIRAPRVPKNRSFNRRRLRGVF